MRGALAIAGKDLRQRVRDRSLLLIAIVVPLLVSTYARIEPRLFGFPFFYWYQLAWVFLAAGLCALSFLLLKREHDAYARSHPRDEQKSAQ